MNGILLVDKPIGWTSHNVVDFLRKKFKLRKVGHGGTLDPIASGLLVMFIGTATKSVISFEHDIKEYIAVMALGYDTFTNDGTGEIIKSYHQNYLKFSDIENAFSKFIGVIEQVPPDVSAIKVQGKRLYKLAYQGKKITTQPRTREIFNLDILHYHYPYVIFRIVCSKGTYVRKICSDVGVLLGCGGYMSSLIRIKSGEFSLSNALSINMLRQIDSHTLDKFVIPCENIVSTRTLHTVSLEDENN